MFLAICQGLGLALAAGIGGMLAVLLMSVLAHLDVGWDLDGTDFSWLEAAWFIPILFALNLVVFLVAQAKGVSAETRRLLLIALAAAFGAIVFAGSLAEETSTWWPGVVAALLIPPVSILVAAALVVLAAGRRRRADEKYEGLRSLR